MRDLMESIRNRPTGRTATAPMVGDTVNGRPKTADPMAGNLGESIETRLYPFLQRPVRTPQGIGVLVRVLGGWALVEFPGLAVLKRFQAEAILPIALADEGGSEA